MKKFRPVPTILNGNGIASMLPQYLNGEGIANTPLPCPCNIVTSWSEARFLPSPYPLSTPNKDTTRATRIEKESMHITHKWYVLKFFPNPFALTTLGVPHSALNHSPHRVLCLTYNLLCSYLQENWSTLNRNCKPDTPPSTPCFIRLTPSPTGLFPPSFTCKGTIMFIYDLIHSPKKAFFIPKPMQNSLANSRVITPQH